MEVTSLKDLLREHIELKGLNTKKAADLTGIPERYIEMMLQGNTEKLPPAPYVQGYIGKLANILDFDKETMWRLYQKESLLSRSGNDDRLPDNRFAARRLGRSWLIGGSIMALLAAYFSYSAYGAFAPPELEITVPEAETSTVAQQTIIVQGKTSPAYTMTLNGGELYVSPEGVFQKEFELGEGLNILEFSAKKFLGGESRVTRTIIYSPPEAPDAPPEKKPKSEEKISKEIPPDAQNATSTRE